jgi:predicted Fe-Mo cluster-binding NifX family protein
MLKIAVPVQNGSLASHFGGAEGFAVFEAAEQPPRIVAQIALAPPSHERGAFPRFLKEQGVTVVLAGDMGTRAVQMLEGFGIEVWTGVVGETPEALVHEYLKGELTARGESCRGGGYYDCGHGRQ